ncbi:hypothetical protein EGW08_020448 [Elysia chlorotica]|uniref:START domain-containing protein n=1 Tax=Elysia chlorotica TaxID=188477 RepID=A0A433SRD3_ELYCH|nr:hypothetical protein EGW08_020448 [Elysia chlorotica]
MLVNNPSVLLSSLDEYISLRRLQKTPLTTITLPQDLTGTDIESSDTSHDQESLTQDTPLLKKVRNFILDRNSSSSGLGGSNGTDLSRKIVLKRYSSILKYGHKDDSGKEGSGAQGSDLSNDSKGFTPLFTSETKPDNADRVTPLHPTLKRSVSDGMALKQSLKMNRELSEVGKLSEGNESDGDDLTDTDAEDHDEADHVYNGDPLSPEDLRKAGFKTLSNQSAAEILAEAMRASNIDLELSAEEQAESSGGWLFSCFEKNIVVLKKQQQNGSTVQSYIGKGFVLAPPKTVWDAVRNPRIRFTYDDTIKKVDIMETLDNSLKIVYFYHESQQFLMKENCDMCILHGERHDGDKFVLTYSSIEHDKCPVLPGVTRAKFLPSGWIIEPARQDNKVYSIVTYLMQIDFGGNPSSRSSLPFQDMISRYPLSIADLQQYLKPAVQLLRRKSLN